MESNQKAAMCFNLNIKRNLLEEIISININEDKSQSFKGTTSNFFSTLLFPLASIRIVLKTL